MCKTALVSAGCCLSSSMARVVGTMNSLILRCRASSLTWSITGRAPVLDWVAQRSRTVQKIEQFDLKPSGDVAVVRGIYSMSGQDGKVLAPHQFMDVFLYREERRHGLMREIAELPIK